MTIRPYRYYLIDLDRTLWDFDSNSEHAIELLLKQNTVLSSAVHEKKGYGADAMHRFFLKYDRINHRLWAEYEKGRLNKDELRWLRFHNAFLLYGIDDSRLAKDFGERYLEQMTHETALMPGAWKMLESIRSAGGKMAVISNGFKEIQYRKLQGSGILHFFSAVVVSETAGCLKPRPGIFEYAVRLLSGIDGKMDHSAWKQVKRDTLMIGDDPVNDIEGAQIFGIDQFYYNHKRLKAISHATYESSDLSPLI